MNDTDAEFERASQLKTEETKRGIRERIQLMWGQLGLIKAECPSCSHIQSIQTDTSTTCRKCVHKYKIYPKNEPSRVRWCPPNKLWLLKNIHSLRTKGKYDEVL